MRLSTRIAALCAGLLVSHHAVAAELPQRWVSAGGALSEWVSAMGGESKLVGCPFQPDATVRATVDIDVDLAFAAHGEELRAVNLETAAAGFGQLNACAKKLHVYPQVRRLVTGYVRA